MKKSEKETPPETSDHTHSASPEASHLQTSPMSGHEHPHHPDDHAHHHTHTQTKLVLNRLSRITGHLEAIKRMVIQERDCSEILVQLAAVDSAIMSVSKVILKDHMDHCIVDAIRENNMSAIEDLKKALETFMK